MLMSQSFADWYDTYFNEHVEGVAGFKGVDEICSDISELLFNKELWYNSGIIKNRYYIIV